MHTIAFLAGEPGLCDYSPDNQMLAETSDLFLVLIEELVSNDELVKVHFTV